MARRKLEEEKEKEHIAVEEARSGDVPVLKRGNTRGPKDHLNSRILQTMRFGIPVILGLRARM